jgi:hypothetical protein
VPTHMFLNACVCSCVCEACVVRVVSVCRDLVQLYRIPELIFPFELKHPCCVRSCVVLVCTQHPMQQRFSCGSMKLVILSA